MARKAKFIVYSDLHIENWKRFNSQGERLNNALDVLKRLRLIAKKHKADLIFAGDLLHKEYSISNTLLSKIMPTLKFVWGKSNPITYAIAGNHDQSEQNSFKHRSPNYIDTFASLFKGLVSINFKKLDYDDDFDLYGIPYITHDVGLIDWIKKIELNPNKINVLVIHTTLPNVQDTDGRSLHSNFDENKLFKALGRFDLVITGHIHKPLEFKIGKTQVIQVGAPQQQRLTDRNCKMGYWIVYEDLSVKFKPFKKYPRFIIVDSDEKIKEDGNFYVVRKEFRTDKTSKVSVGENFKTKNMSKLAINYCRNKGIRDKEKKRMLKKVLKAANND